MNVRVHYTAQLRTALNRTGDELELPSAATVGDLFDSISQLHGEPFDNLAKCDNGQLHPSLLVCIGDQCIGQDFAVELQTGDEVTLLSPVSGG